MSAAWSTCCDELDVADGLSWKEAGLGGAGGLARGVLVGCASAASTLADPGSALTSGCLSSTGIGCMLSEPFPKCPGKIDETSGRESCTLLAALEAPCGSALPSFPAFRCSTPPVRDLAVRPPISGFVLLDAARFSNRDRREAIEGARSLSRSSAIADSSGRPPDLLCCSELRSYSWD